MATSTVWLSCSILFVLLMAFVTLGGAIVCRERDSQLLEEISRETDPPSECVLGCTALTFRKMQETLDTHTVRFRDSKADNLGGYCWSMQMKCNSGERLQNAYIMLPVDVSQEVGRSLGLKSTLPLHDDIMWPHLGPTPLANNCGLRFDVTGHFNSENRWQRFCVQIVPQQSNLKDGYVRCPPFLVTIWQHQNHSPTKQGGG